MKILLVEDDYIQSDLICEALEQAFPSDVVELIRTEHEFRSRLVDIKARPPDIIILDIMLRWTLPSRDMPELPQDVREEGLYRAGFRCKKLLSEHARTRDIPVILYTVMEVSDIAEDLQDIASGAVYLRKEADMTSLIQLIRARIIS